jgi:hypothetical protein
MEGKMDDLSSSLIVVVVTGIVVAAIFFFSHQSKARNQREIQEMAVLRGWNYTNISERLAWGTRLSAKNWELVTRSESIGQVGDSGSSNIQSDTRFTADWITPPGYTLMIGPRLSGGTPGLFLPPEYAGLREINPNPTGLSADYICLAESGFDPDVLIRSSILRQLSAWPDKNRPLIMIKPSELEITIKGQRLDKPLDLERLIQLGESVLSFTNQ